LLLLFCCPNSYGLGPENCLLIVNANDPDGLAVANHYRSVRKIPDRNVVYLDYKSNKQIISFDEYQRLIRDPVLEHMKKKKLEGTISVWVTPTGLPHMVGKNSLSGVIFFGAEQQTVQRGNSPAEFKELNRYAMLMQGFHPPPPGKIGPFLHMRLDAGSYEQTVAMINRSANSDNSHPDGTVYLCDGIGERASRKDSIPGAMRFLAALKIPAVHVVNNFSVQDKHNVLGIYTGVWSFDFKNLDFVPGALGDHLTSLGGSLHGSLDQMLCTVWLQKGCSASYGTVIEPWNYAQKFPMPFLYAYYGMGLTAVESYWMSVIWPQQGLFVGDPLTKPFANPPSIAITNLTEDQQVSGNFDIDLEVEAASNGAGIQRIDVYIDELLAGTMPAPPVPPGIRLKATLGDKTREYVTAGKETLAQITAGFNASIKGIAPTMEAEASAASVLIVDREPSSQIANLKVESSAPELTARTFSSRQKVSPSREPVEKTWQFTGAGLKGDVIELTLSEDGQPKPAIVYELEREIPAKNIGLLMASTVRPNVPDGFKVLGVPSDDKSPLGGVKVLVDNKLVGHQLTAMLKIKNAPGSTLRAPNNGALVPFTTGNGDPTNNLVFVRLGYGQPRVKRRLSLPSTSMADGRHTLRIVATEGSGMSSTSTLLRSFVVHNGADSLKLAIVSDSIPLQTPSAPVATATLSTANANAKIKFLIDGREAGALPANDAPLKITPATWGIGRHVLTARTEVGGKDLLSENAIEFDIVP
jgi:uncharacterized protein (TIGR03790 family)